MLLVVARCAETRHLRSEFAGLRGVRQTRRFCESVPLSILLYHSLPWLALELMLAWHSPPSQRLQIPRMIRRFS